MSKVTINELRDIRRIYEWSWVGIVERKYGNQVVGTLGFLERKGYMGLTLAF